MQRLLPAGADATDDDIASWYEFDPGVTLRSNMIMTADGVAVGPDGLSKSLSGPEDGRLLGLQRALSDAIIVAAGTLREEQYNPIRTRQSMASSRQAAGLAPHPVLVMVTREPRIDASFRALAQAPVRPFVLCAQDNAVLADVADVIECPAADGTVDLLRAKDVLADRGFSRLLTEGGPRLLNGFLAAGVLDEYCLTLAPSVLGGEQALRPTTGPLVPTDFSLVHAATADDYLFLRYRR